MPIIILAYIKVFRYKDSALTRKFCYPPLLRYTKNFSGSLRPLHSIRTTPDCLSVCRNNKILEFVAMKRIFLPDPLVIGRIFEPNTKYFAKYQSSGKSRIIYNIYQRYLARGSARRTFVSTQSPNIVIITLTEPKFFFIPP